MHKYPHIYGSLFAEYSFSVDKNPGRHKVVADELLHRLDFEPATRSNSGVEPTIATLVASVPSSTLLDDVKKAYAKIRIFYNWWIIW